MDRFSLKLDANLDIRYGRKEFSKFRSGDLNLKSIGSIDHLFRFQRLTKDICF